MGMIAAFALILELFGRRSRMSGIWLTVALVGLVLSQSRSGWSVALVGVLIWSGGRFGKAWTILLASTAGIIGWSLVGEQINKTGLTGRDDIWAVAWQVFLRNPVIGAGQGGLREAVLTNGIGSYGAQAHNQLLDTLAKAGLVGTVLLLSFFVRSLRRARHLAHQRSGVALALLAGLAVRSLFESPIDGGFAVLLLVALLACQADSSSVPTTSTRPAFDAQVVPANTSRPRE
jgi:O-antigen ligase